MSNPHTHDLKVVNTESYLNLSSISPQGNLTIGITPGTTSIGSVWTTEANNVYTRPKAPVTLEELRDYIRIDGMASALPMQIALSEAILALCAIIEERTTNTCLYCNKEKMCNDPTS